VLAQCPRHSDEELACSTWSLRPFVAALRRPSTSDSASAAGSPAEDSTTWPWVTLDGTMCYQVMECEDRALLDEWISAWTDLVEFSVIPVMTSGDAAVKFTPV
jgi:hypothetical protein